MKHNRIDPRVVQTYHCFASTLSSMSSQLPPLRGLHHVDRFQCLMPFETLIIRLGRIWSRIRTFIRTPSTSGSSPSLQIQKSRSLLPSRMQKDTTSLRSSPSNVVTDTFLLSNGPSDAKLFRISRSSSSRSLGGSRDRCGNVDRGPSSAPGTSEICGGG